MPSPLTFPGIKETEVNEFMMIGLGVGVTAVVMIAIFLICHRKQKRRRLEHPMIPSHAHFHTCESIGERFATSSSMDSVSLDFIGLLIMMWDKKHCLPYYP